MVIISSGSKPGQSAACDSYLGLMDSLRQALNRGLFLGLEEYESHFALYPPGASTSSMSTASVMMTGAWSRR